MSVSPVIKKTVGIMTFPEAIAAVTNGKKITRLEWDDKGIYGQLRNSTLQIHLEDGWHTWIVNDGDLFGDDWMVVE